MGRRKESSSSWGWWYLGFLEGHAQDIVGMVVQG